MKILICGSGSAAVQLALLCKKFFKESFIAFYTRDSERNKTFLKLFARGDLRFSVSSQKKELNKFCGILDVNCFTLDLEDLSHTFDFVIFAQPTFDYATVLKELICKNRRLLTENAVILTASSQLGVGQHLLEILKEDTGSHGLIVCGDYLAITVRDSNNPFNFISCGAKSLVRYCLLGNVSKIFKDFMSDFLCEFAPDLKEYFCSFETEQGNTNLFHLPIVVQPFVVSWFFNPNEKRRFFYAPYPWGAISYQTIRQIIEFESELLQIYKSLNLPEINFFKFRLARSGMPIEEIPQEIIENYPRSSIETKVGLHAFYCWMSERKMMSGITGCNALLDLESLPKFPQLVVKDNFATVNRIPFEDFISLVSILKYSNQKGILTPLLERLCRQWKENCESEPPRYNYKLGFNFHDYSESITRNSDVLIKKSENFYEKTFLDDMSFKSILY